MDTDRELLRMQRHAAMRPGLTPLQEQLVADTSAAFTRRMIGHFRHIAEELSTRREEVSQAFDQAAAAALHRALVAASKTFALHWELLHGHPLPTRTGGSANGDHDGTRDVDRPGETAQAAEATVGARAFVETLGECAVLAAIAGDIERGDAIRHGLRVVAPQHRDHEVHYALGLSFNGHEARADALLTELMREGGDEARAASAFGFVLQARGDERWRDLFDRVRRTSNNPDLRRFVEFWTDFAEAPVQ